MRWHGNVAIEGPDNAILSEEVVFNLRPEMTYGEKIATSMRLPDLSAERRVKIYLKASFKAFLPWEHSESLEFVADLGSGTLS